MNKLIQGLSYSLNEKVKLEIVKRSLSKLTGSNEGSHWVFFLVGGVPQSSFPVAGFVPASTNMSVMSLKFHTV